MFSQVFSSIKCLKVVKCFKYARNRNYAGISHNVLVKGEGIVKQSPSCRNFFSYEQNDETFLKENLIKSLKYIKSSNEAHLFCGLLFDANLILENPKRSSKHSDWQVDSVNKIVDRLKKLLTESKSKIKDEGYRHIVGRILEGVYTLLPGGYRDKPAEHLQTDFEIGLIEFLNLSNTSSSDYLKKLLGLLNFYFKEANELNNLYPGFSTEDLQYNLEVLMSNLRHSAKLKTEELFDFIFDIGQKHSGFSNEEKQKIGNLMIHAVELIVECVEDVKSFPPCSILPALQKRSSIQFLIDDYAKFPALNESLLIEFYKGKINNSRIILEDLLLNFYEENTDYLDGKKDLKYARSVYSLAERSEDCAVELRQQQAAGMPESHTWWDMY